MAYIAGFLDGDGSLMIQFKRRGDNGKIRVMFTICFYQDSRHDKPLRWIRGQLRIGYLSKRNDGMTELRINGFKAVKKILIALERYLRFKRKQAKLLLAAISILEKRGDYKKQMLAVGKISDMMAKENYYSAQRKYDYSYIKKALKKS